MDTKLQRNTKKFLSYLFFTWTTESIANSSLFSPSSACFLRTRKAQSVSEQWIIDETQTNMIQRIKWKDLWPVLDPSVARGGAAWPVWPGAPAQRGDQGLQWAEVEWNSYFSVQFVPLSQFIGAILASSGMCQVQFDLYRCWGRRLIWNNEEVSPILPYYNTIVTVVVYFCSQGYTGLLRFGDRCGHLAHLNIRREEEQVSDPQFWCGCLLQVQQDWRASWEPATAPRPGPHFMSRVRYWNWLSIHKCRHLVNRLICTLPFQ